MLLQVSYAMRLLHKHNYIHGDLHPGNVGVMKTGLKAKIKLGKDTIPTYGYQYKLIDFGLTLNIDDLCYELLIRGDDEKKAIVFILEKFFDKTEDGYAHKRCDVVIKKYKAKSNQSRNAVNTRWAKEKGKDTDVIRESYDRNTNQEQLTNNKEQFIEFVKPLDVNLEIWNNIKKHFVLQLSND